MNYDIPNDFELIHHEASQTIDSPTTGCLTLCFKLDQINRSNRKSGTDLVVA